MPQAGARWPHAAKIIKIIKIVISLASLAVLSAALVRIACSIMQSHTARTHVHKRSLASSQPRPM